MKDRAIGGAQLWERLGIGYAAGLFFVYAVLILHRTDPPSLADLGVILRAHMLGQADPRHLVKFYPVPNGAVTLAIALLALGMSWAMAAKVWLCLQFGLFFAAIWTVTRVRTRLGKGGNSAIWCLLPTQALFNVNFWYGFFNFELGLCLAVFFVAVLLSDVRREWVAGGLLLAGFFSHMVPFAFMALALLFFVWQTRRWRLLLQLVPAAALCAWYLVGRFLLHGDADAGVGLTNEMRQFSAEFWAFKVNSYLKSFGWVNLGKRSGSVTLHLLGTQGFTLLFAVNAVLCVVLGWCMLRACTEAFRSGKKERFLWSAAIVYASVSALLPSYTLGISDPGSRLLEVAMTLGVLLCASSRMLRAAAVCAVPLAVVSLFLFVRAAYTVLPVESAGGRLPGMVVQFAHVPNHNKDMYLDAMRQGNLSLAVFPTGFLLNAPGARLPPPHEE